MGQTVEEKCDAIKTLLPLIAEHLHRHPHFRVIPAAKWVSEGPPEERPPQPPPCDERCLECTAKCADEAWVREYRRMRARYPVVKKIEKLLELEMSYDKERRVFRAALFGVYITPWDAMDTPYWRDLAERGIGWIMEHCVRRDGTPYQHFPTYEGELPRRRFYTDPSKLPRDVEIICRYCEGSTYTSIARAVRCSKTTIKAVLHGQVVRRGRTQDAHS